jgi:hypothetical protein
MQELDALPGQPSVLFVTPKPLCVTLSLRFSGICSQLLTGDCTNA